MAEQSVAGDLLSPTEYPPARQRAAEGARAALLPPATPGVASGLPIIDVPLLVEPVGFDEPAAEIRPPAADRRPVRRRFLPPVAKPSADADEAALPLHNLRPSATRRAAAAPLLRAPPSPPGPSVEPGDRALRPSRRPDARSPARSGARLSRHRPILVGAGVSAALALALLFELKGGIAWVTRLPGAVLQATARPQPMAPAGKPPEDPARRLAYYTDRAKAGDSEAQIALAVLYAKGEGVPQNYAEAAAWFRRAAEKGVMRAQYDLGVLYERGRGVPEDAAQAVAWYRKAAEQNHPLAQYNLAVAFTKGEGVHRDPFEAAVWYHRAAAQGVVAAMVNLAILYERGEGVETSTADAYAWYRAAARRGSAPAKRRADEMLQAFSPWDQTRAEAKMADIAASIRDAIGERARLAGRVAEAPAPTEATAAPGPRLKSGLADENRRTSPAAAAPAPDNP
jgi:hypothetical protein